VYHASIDYKNYSAAIGGPFEDGQKRYQRSPERLLNVFAPAISCPWSIFSSVLQRTHAIRRFTLQSILTVKYPVAIVERSQASFSAAY